MVYIIIFLIIGVINIIKWTLIKTRLYIAAIPISIILIFFKDWYEQNTLLVDAIAIVFIVGIIVSWVITIIKFIKNRKRNREKVLDWAYERYGEPVMLTKKHT